jgi:TolA-binding protein
MNALFGHPEAAEAPLRKALKSPAHWSGTHTALAYSLACRGQAAAAREELAQVSKELVAENVSLDALYFAGLAYDKLGETTIAHRIFARATQRWPRHPWSEPMREYLAGH